MTAYLVAALYKFVSLPDFRALKAPLERAAAARGVVGSLLLAEEGVNGTLAAPAPQMRAFLETLRADPRLADLGWKESWAETAPFGRLKVRLKREIVSMGAPGIVSEQTVGTYVEPEDWNALIRRPGVAVIDVRNDYEVAIGRFAGAIDPETTSFRDFPAWAAADPRLADKPAVAMYCTGGIRCEKASAHLRAQGFAEVFHLRGGVLRYLETARAADSLWSGHCFVFDERVSVGHGLERGPHALCRGCRRPLSAEDRLHPDYQPGIACARCAHSGSEARRRRRAERQRQIQLARARGERHLGPAPERVRDPDSDPDHDPLGGAG